MFQDTSRDNEPRQTLAESIDETLEAAIEKAKATHSDDIVGAARALEAAVRADRKLYDEITGPAVSSLCYQAIKRAFHRERQIIWQAPRHSPDTTAAGIAGAAEANVKDLLDITLPLEGFPRLRGALKPQVEQAAAYYGAQAAANRIRAVWLSMVAARLPDDKAVGDVFDNDTLRTLQEEAEANA